MTDVKPPRHDLIPGLDMRLSRLALLEDRYLGSYSRGVWLAIADRDEEYLPGITRLQFVLDHDDGPFSDDPDAQAFWRDTAPSLAWLAVGGSPEEAIANLRTRYVGP
ncbi:hypothetical protein WM29_22985 [Burkholderia ubonensis]|uniref:hypothetical protein n=1 Tax=Burkholderia ubonensis TaxID=101571 RepID=UPI000841ACCB|nr:hypothetical protein [Burkholderia ubonensis]AOK61996.1 hypothetical protein WM29_22985 [Burkholderia ubonensis]